MTLDVIDGVYNAGIHFNLPPANDSDAAWPAYARFVIAIHIRAHCQFRFVLRRIQQLKNLSCIAEWIHATGNSS